MKHLILGCAAALALAACGDDGATVAVDAAVDAPSIDAFVCGATDCGGTSADTCGDEQHCGGCNTACDPGEGCLAGECACPAAFVPAEPSFLQQQTDATILPGATLGIGGLIGGEIDALIVAYPTNSVEVNTPYTLSGASLGTPPFAAAGYDVDINTFTPAAAFYATAGTLTFTEVCAGGFKGTLTGAHFAAVEGLMNPTLVPGGCSFDVPSITFAYGDPCPTPQ